MSGERHDRTQRSQRAQSNTGFLCGLRGLCVVRRHQLVGRAPGACSVALAVLVTSAGWSVAARAADPPRRKPLDQGQRTALMALLNAVDAATRAGGAAYPSAEHVSWDSCVLKAQH